MSLLGVIDSFATGTYTVTRAAAGSFSVGRYTAGSSSTFNITASVQPVSGRDLQVLPDGQHADEARVVYTATELRTRGTGEPDTISIDSEAWEVFRVERWQAFGDAHWRAFVSRRPVP